MRSRRGPHDRGCVVRKHLIAFCCLMIVPALAGQVKTGTIIGRVSDEQGASLPGVAVEAVSRMLAGGATAITDIDGRYQLSDLPSGTYTLKYEISGFKTQVRGPILLWGGQTFTVNATLETEVTPFDESPLINVMSNFPLYHAPFVRGDHAVMEDKEGLTLLHLAAIEDSRDEAEQAIAMGQDVNARTFDGWTPLHIAAHERSYEVAVLLLLKGAAVNLRDEFGWTPLHSAAASRSDDIVLLLLDTGASVNAKTVDGWTPLHAALENNSGENAELLVAYGADVRARTDSGLTPLHCLAMTWYNVEDLAELLIAHGAEVNAKDSEGRTPLHCLAMSEDQHEGLAELLIEKGADVNAKDSEGRTPLHIAVADELPGALSKLLLARGADVKAKTESGLTPLHCLTMSEDADEDLDLAEILMINGADVNAKDREGRTPLLLAEEAGHTKLAALLIRHGARR